MERKKRRPPPEQAYQQMSFDEVENLPTPEIILDRCMVTAPPTYVKKGKGHLWDCIVHTLPVWFDLDQDTEYQLHATTYASKANKEHIKPGDMVAVAGIPYTQEIIKQDETTQVLHHLTISKLTVIDRAPEPKPPIITIFEAKLE